MRFPELRDKLLEHYKIADALDIISQNEQLRGVFEGVSTLLLNSDERGREFARLLSERESEMSISRAHAIYALFLAHHVKHDDPQ